MANARCYENVSGPCPKEVFDNNGTFTFGGSYAQGLIPLSTEYQFKLTWFATNGSMSGSTYSDKFSMVDPIISSSTTSTSASTATTDHSTTSSGSSVSNSASSTSTPAPAQPTTSTVVSESSSPAKSKGLSTGAKAGIGIGVAIGAFLVLLGALLLCRRRRTRKTTTLPRGLDTAYDPYEIPVGSKSRGLDGSPSSGSDQAMKAASHHEREPTPPRTPPRETNSPPPPSPREQWTPRSDVINQGEDVFALDPDEILADESQMTPEQLRQWEEEERIIDEAIRESERKEVLKAKRESLQNGINALRSGSLS